MPEQLFGNPEPTKTNDDSTTENLTNYDDLLIGIKAEDGRQKFESVDKALESIPHAQAEIQRLREELSQVNDRANDIDGLKELLKATEQPDPIVEDPAPTSAEPTLSETAVKDLIADTLKQTEQANQRSDNLKRVELALQTKYGSSEEALKAVETKAKELGMTTESLTALSVQYPDVVLKHFDTVGEQPIKPVQSTVNTDVATPEDNTALQPVPLGASNKDLVASYREHIEKYGDN